MRRALKVAAWAAVFLTSAGIGAFIAANTDPFPPGVDRPGAPPTNATPSPTPTTTPAPSLERWSGTLRSLTYHRLYVGGTCTTRWRGDLRFSVNDRGWVRGAGVARLDGGLECDFPTAQVQARIVRLSVAGRLRGGRLVLRLDRSAVAPAGAIDLGGFLPILPERVVIPVRGGSASTLARRQRTDEEGRGIYVWSTQLRVRRSG